MEKIALLIALLLNALFLSGCTAAGYITSGIGAARSEVRFMDLEERLQAIEAGIEDSVCRK